MRQKMADGDPWAHIRQLRKIFRDRIVVANLATFGEHHDRHRRELLGYGGEIRRRLRLVSARRAGGGPERIPVDNHAVSCDQDAAVKLTVFIQRGQHRANRFALRVSGVQIDRC